MFRFLIPPNGTIGQQVSKLQWFERLLNCQTEPERLVLEGIGNAVFDVQWRSDDQRLVCNSF